MGRVNWIPIASAGWLLISVWPVVNYYFPQRAPKSPLIDDLSAFPQTYRNPLTAAREVDHFDTYLRTPQCSFSSLDLHKPSYPLCPDHDTQTLLTAMSSGGRIGNDAPYQPRGCDMRWFSTEEICDILSRFSRVTVLGDSLMREVALAFHVFLRKDLVHGGHAEWMGNPEGEDCSCEASWDTRACAFYVTLNSDQLYPDHKELMACPMETTAFVKYHVMTSYPIADDQLEGYREIAYHTKPEKPHAVIMGAGLWDDVEQNKTMAWVDQVVNATEAMSPWLFEPGQWQPRLFLTPNAAHAGKSSKYLVKQGNIPLSIFELALGQYVKEVYGIDHLGTYNMSIQTTSYDGTHAGMRVNLVKVMAIFNWLNSLDVSRW